MEKVEKSNSGRPKPATTAENAEEIRRLLEENPHISARRNDPGLSAASLNRIPGQIYIFTLTELKFVINSAKAIFNGVNVSAIGFEKTAEIHDF